MKRKSLWTLLTIMVFTFALASSAVAATTPMFFPGTIGEFVVGDKAVDLNLLFNNQTAAESVLNGEFGAGATTVYLKVAGQDNNFIDIFESTTVTDTFIQSTVHYLVNDQGVQTAYGSSGLAISGTTADNLAVSVSGDTVTVAQGANATQAIGSFAINFNHNIVKTTADDIVLRAYNGTSQLTISNASAVKSLLFSNFGSGAANALTGNVINTYSAVCSAINSAAGGTVTSLQFDIKNATNTSDVLTVTLNITPLT